jgi:hypothetical protein
MPLWWTVLFAPYLLGENFTFVTIARDSRLSLFSYANNLELHPANFAFHQLNNSHLLVTKFNRRGTVLYGSPIRIAEDEPINVSGFQILGVRDCCPLERNDATVFRHRNLTYVQMTTKEGQQVCALTTTVTYITENRCA